MVFEGEQSKNDKLQFIEAGASHDNSPDEGEEEEDLVQAGVTVYSFFFFYKGEKRTCRISDKLFVCISHDPFFW